jgi:decaprenyl-phosphate phosphoribosyltransferase
MKRFAEYRSIGDPKRAAQYRRSFGFYTEGRLLASTVIYIAGACLLFGAFLMRYRLELVIAFPLVAWVVGEYFHLGLRPDSPVQAPEHLYRERRLMLALLACATALGVLLFVNVPLLQSVFEKSQSH